MTLRAKASFFRRVARTMGGKQPRQIAPSAEDCFEHNLSHSHFRDQLLFRVRNKRGLLSKSWRVTSVAKPKMPSLEISTP